MVQLSRKAKNLIFLAAAIISLAYNAVWIYSSGAILELSCISHYSIVHSEAIDSINHHDWMRASHLYAYLEEFGPYSDRGCQSGQSLDSSLLLPFSAIAGRWRLSRLDEYTDRIKVADENEFRTSYAEAASHLRLIQNDTPKAQK